MKNGKSLFFVLLSLCLLLAVFVGCAKDRAIFYRRSGYD